MSEASNNSIKSQSDHEDDMKTQLNSLDFNNPLFLHPSDTSNIAIINIKLKGTENYSVWANSMLLALKINSLTQNGSSVSDYYHNLNSLWRQYDCLTKLPKCVCDASVELNDFNNRTKLMQFLMGLHDAYQPIRTTLLTKDPLPSVKAAFATISSDESHRGVVSSSKGQPTVFNAKFDVKRKQTKQIPRCTHCNLTGHTIDKCYELIGYPSNYKKKPNILRNQGVSNSSSNKECPKDITNSMSQPFSPEQVAGIMALISDKNPAGASSANMSGNWFKPVSCNSIFCANVSKELIQSNCWIIDSGANQHMVTSESNMFNCLDASDLNLSVRHPNGTKEK
ncbi:uncharacterized protein LOC143622620 [Bidens hawaiensis]|uniref:uncharacterized protein LOC143622620 n=1 Tax=Bidens hawaiensis TaxID=980011 RepID=UPI004049F1B7